MSVIGSHPAEISRGDHRRPAKAGGPVDRHGVSRDTLSVIILNDYGFVNGGQAKVAIDSAVALSASGVDVVFVAGVGPLDDRLLEAGVECHVVGNHDILSDPDRLGAAARGIWNVHAAEVVAKTIASRDPDTTVVHVHGWAKSLSPSIGPVVTRAGAAHVYTLHEYFLACPNGGFYNHRKGEICQQRALGAGCLLSRCDSRSDWHKAWRLVRQVALWKASGFPRDLREIIYLTAEQIPVMEPYLPEQARWHHLPNPAGSRPSQRVVAEDKEVFLFIGRLSPEKGAEVVAAAAREANVTIAFCGSGEQEAAVRQANPDAIMLGWLSEEELESWMKRSRCLLFPSLWYETYGLVAADALRCGLPVLLSDSVVAASFIRHEEEGLHVPAGDVAAWAAAMTRMRDGDLVRRLSEAAFAAGEHFLERDQYTQRLIGIYRAALSRQRQDARPAQVSAA